MTSKDVQHEPEAQSNMISSLPRPLGLVCLKLITQDTSGLRFRRSTYGWKDNLIRKPIQVVLHQKLFRINRNCGHKLACRICQGAVTPSFGPLDRVSCLGPSGGASRIGDDPKTFIIIHRHRHYVLSFAQINLSRTVSPFIGLGDPNFVSLMIHLQFGCILSCSCLCSSIRRQGIAFLARSTVHRQSIT